MNNIPSDQKVLKNPGVAAVLSFFIPGLGQIYNGQIIKGYLLIFFFAICWFFFFYGFISFVSINNILISLILISLPLLLSIFAVKDAYVEAENFNR